MGSPTSLTKWIPEDDLLLKNAVEIQEMHFAFEVNESAIWHHIKKLHRSIQEQSAFRFDWKPEKSL